MYSRQVFAKNCSSMSLVMKYCPISTTLMNPASIQNLLTLFSCESLSIRSSYFCNRRFWYAGLSFSKGTSAFISLRQLIVPSAHQVALIDREGIHILHICLRRHLKTELIGKNNYPKNSLNCFLIRSKMYRQFAVSFAFQLTLDNGVVALKIGHPLSTNSNSIFSAM